MLGLNGICCCAAVWQQSQVSDILAVVENTPLGAWHVEGDVRILRASARDYSHRGLSLGYNIACSLAHGPLE